ncbi:MAG: flagellar basal body protein [Phycisphaerales bacterium]|nr:flagellar basal body protein [Phycisphaerales bacterium]
MFGSLDISTSGLVAQRTRMTAIADNIANQSTLLASDGSYAPFQARAVLFAAGDALTGASEGVTATVTRQNAFRWADPSDPAENIPEHVAEAARKAGMMNSEGLIQVPEINEVAQFVDSMEALRSYEANISVADATKRMIDGALQLLA